MKMKFMDSKDTSWNLQYKFFFNKLKNDSIYPIAFNSERFAHGIYLDNKLYTGNEFVNFSRKDSTASIMPKSKWINKLMNLSHNDIISFYQPFTSSDCHPLPQTSDYKDGNHFFSFIGNEGSK